MKKNAFKKILHTSKNRVFSYAFYLLKNREDAEDITQDVFIRLWEHWSSIDQKKVVGWMMRVTHNCCVDLMRQKRASASPLRSAGRVDSESALLKADANTDPELQYAFTETQRVLLSAMETLPERTKSILLLHYFQGLKYEVIGEILNAKVSTVKVAVHRGKKVLRQVLAEEFPERMGTGPNGCTVS